MGMLQTENQGTGNTFAELFRHWRKKSGLSQLELSVLSNVSQKHISFLESGRSHPTEDMILHLAKDMGLPFRIQNLILSAAGYLPRYTENNLDAPEMVAIKRSLDFILKQQMPYPAFVLDRHWNMLLSNESAQKLLGWFAQDEPLRTFLSDEQPLNILRLTLHPKGLKPFIQNYQEVASVLLKRLHREALLDDLGSYSSSLYEELMAVNSEIRFTTELLEGHVPVLTTEFENKGTHLSVFSSITTLGTPCDITLQELRIESLFPMNTETEKWFVAL